MFGILQQAHTRCLLIAVSASFLSEEGVLFLFGRWCEMHHAPVRPPVPYPQLKHTCNLPSTLRLLALVVSTSNRRAMHRIPPAICACKKNSCTGTSHPSSQANGFTQRVFFESAAKHPNSNNWEFPRVVVFCAGPSPPSCEERQDY